MRIQIFKTILQVKNYFKKHYMTIKLKIKNSLSVI